MNAIKFLPRMQFCRNTTQIDHLHIREHKTLMVSGYIFWKNYKHCIIPRGNQTMSHKWCTYVMILEIARQVVDWSSWKSKNKEEDVIVDATVPHYVLVCVSLRWANCRGQRHGWK